MHQYSNNIGKLMPIRNFGTVNDKPITHCILTTMFQAFDGMTYWLDLYSADGEKLGGRWVTRHMYRYHVMNKPY